MKKITILNILLIGIILAGGNLASADTSISTAIARSGELICSGDFTQALEVIKPIDSPEAEAMRTIIAEYNELQARREKAHRA